MGKNKMLIGHLCAIICQVFFGFSYFFTKTSTGAVSAFTLLSWRFLVAFIFFNLCVLTHIVKVDFKGKSFLPLVQIALLQPVIYYIGETYGISLTTTAESGIILACFPIATLIFSTIVLREPPTKQQTAGIGTAAVGVVIIALLKGLEAKFSLPGYAMLIMGVITYSLCSVLCRKAAEFSSIEKTYVMTMFGAVAFTLMALVENALKGTLKQFILLPFTNMNFLISVLYLGAGCSVAAFIFYNTAIDYIGTNSTTSYVGVATIVNVLASIFILKEGFSVLQGIGTALVLLGVYIANATTAAKIHQLTDCEHNVGDNLQL